MAIRLVLSSKDIAKLHSNNTAYDFRVTLPRPLCLLGYWVVALTEFTVHDGEIAKPTELYVCSDLCDDSVVGGNEVPLLRRVYHEKDGNTIFSTPYDVPLRIGQLHDIHVYIRDAENKPASFLKGQVTVTLHLKRQPFD